MTSSPEYTSEERPILDAILAGRPLVDAPERLHSAARAILDEAARHPAFSSDEGAYMTAGLEGVKQLLQQKYGWLSREARNAILHHCTMLWK